MLKANLAFIALLTVFTFNVQLAADPCGMVPPITTDGVIPITRIGEQRTYVFFKDGVETFVIRPGFSGKVDEFGMLIPFPTPPALRKVPDNVFEQITAAIDPPEVVIDLRPRRFLRAAIPQSAEVSDSSLAYKAKDEVRVLRKEAVGMYEVAVLEAGSAAALKRWMDQNGYQYPNGMDTVCDEYVDDGWCFVAVKTKVGQKGGVDPQPGQRSVTSQLPDGSTFDGNVQAMGFRFKTDQLVVPMRLSAFNQGELRNIVYLLTDGPRRIRKIPEEYVVRQIPGSQLAMNVTNPLPLRILGGDIQDISPRRLKSINNQRDPHPKNGAAKELFAADLLAVSSGQLALPQEEREKELLQIGERLGLRGAEIDKANAEALSTMTTKTVTAALKDIESMTLTVVDGDFPRDVIAGANLTFAEYTMAQSKNSATEYDAKTKKPAIQRSGKLILGEWRPKAAPNSQSPYRLVAALSLLPISLLWFTRGRRRTVLTGVFALALLIPIATLRAWEPPLLQTSATVSEAIADLKDSKTAEAAVTTLHAEAEQGRQAYHSVVSALVQTARLSDEITQRGWAIVALGEIGGYDADELLLSIHADENQSMLVRTWAAAARVAMTRTSAGLIEKAQLINKFPAIGRPIGMRLVSQLNRDGDVSIEKLLTTAQQVPQIQPAIAPAILAQGADALVKTMTGASDQDIRRQAAAYLGSLAQQDSSVPKAVIGAYAFDPAATDVAWKGGPLFLPGLAWEKDDARALVGNLIAWHLWCDLNGRSAEQKQIHNNLRSLALARSAGYESPGFREANTVAWLKAWGKTVGKDALRELLAQQGVSDTAKYANVLNEL